MRTFWVNQGQTFEEERRARVLWAPKLSRPREGQDVGTPRGHWDRMLEASAGDLVFHYSRGAVRAWSNVLAPAFDGPPPFEDPTTRWSVDGRVIRVEMQELDSPIDLDDIPLELRTERDVTGWPFSRSGAVKQVYLTEVDGSLADWLLSEVGLRVDVAQLSAWPDQVGDVQIEYRGDRRVVVNARGEQSLLRKHLFGDDLLATCALCGRDLPVAMLVTAHIKRRADTSRAERGRTDTVMPACLIGCDSLFELGYVTVARGGTVERGPRRTPMTDDLARALDALIGRTCSVWSEATEQHFAHHRRFQKARARSYGLS
ncbi:hypothetical protein ACIPNL_04445 [Curtobacterium sp. NPDC090221]|uniref:hypothetical protein n=2 Tax=unclassified Curtobacterium TaxID=257496 RepID=UPI0037F83F53